MKKTLHLPLKEVWYRMIQSGEKPEEYREINLYWFRRLLWCYVEIESWLEMDAVLEDFRNGRNIEEHFRDYRLAFRFNSGSQGDYTHALFTLGYPKRDDEDKNMLKEIKEIVIAQGNPAWGAEQGKYYFVIRLKQ